MRGLLSIVGRGHDAPFPTDSEGDARNSIERSDDLVAAFGAVWIATRDPNVLIGIDV